MNRYTVFQTACAVLALVMGVLVLIGTKAHSQDASQCAPPEAMKSTLEKQYGETVTAGGILGPNGIMYITANPKTHTFTVLVRGPNGLSCIIMGGKGWALADPAKVKGNGL